MALMGFSVIVFLLIGIFLIPYIFFLITLQNAVARCSIESRTIRPGQIWLVLIPLFNIVWMFIMTSKISETLDREFKRRGRPKPTPPAQGLGLAYCLMTFASIIPFVGFIAYLVVWIIYWASIAGFSRELTGADDVALDSSATMGEY